MIVAPLFRQRHLDASGNPLSGGKLNFYAAGTTNRQDTYTTAAGSVANANPVILDSDGYANVFLDPTKSYKAVLTDSADVVLWTVDNITGAFSTGVPGWSATETYSKGNIVRDATDNGLLYVSRTNSNLGNALTSVTNWALFPGGIQRATVTANTTLAVTDHGGLIRSNSTAGNLTHTLPPISTTPIGFEVSVKDIGTGGFATSVKGSGSDLVDGNNTWSETLSTLNAATFRNNGTSYDVV